MTGFVYHRPRSLDEALRLKQADAGARFIAGGTDLQLGGADGEERPPALISLRSVAELGGDTTAWFIAAS
ncbi:MAG: FAD binding domain-containing protein, partial [Planctomycetota bacterium]